MFKSQWNNISNNLNRSSTNERRNNFQIVYSKTPHAEFLVDLVSENPNWGAAAYNYFMGINSNIHSSKNHLLVI